MPELIRPDFSNFVVHFTTDAKPYCAKKHADDKRVKQIVASTAYDRLTNILNIGEVWATPMNWTNKPAVCLTECTWISLLDHASRYSKFGLGFSKDFIFSQGGGPAFYVRPDLFDKQATHGGFESDVMAFVTPFMPVYASSAYKTQHFKGKIGVDFSYEREWRVPHDLKFSSNDVKFVILSDYHAMAKFPTPTKDAIGREKFIQMDQYELIERMWPTHIVPKGP